MTDDQLSINEPIIQTKCLRCNKQLVWAEGYHGAGWLHKTTHQRSCNNGSEPWAGFIPLRRFDPQHQEQTPNPGRPTGNTIRKPTWQTKQWDAKDTEPK